MSSWLLVVSWGLLALAGLLFSPWLGAIAALATLAAFVFTIGGGALLRGLFPAWAFLWLLVPPPFGLDQTLVSALQTLTARCSSAVLDLLGVFHVLAGHVVEVGSRRFLVEEACSGTHSFFALVPATLFFVLWLRRRFLPATLLLIAVAGWVLVANVVRVVGVTFLTSQWGFDVTAAHPWRHEVFGWLVFAMTLGLMASTDQFLLFFTSWDRSPRHEPALLGLQKRNAASLPANREPTCWPDWGRTALARWPVALAYGALAGVQLAFFWLMFFWPSTAIPGLGTLRADTLPAQWGPWQRDGYTEGWVGHYGAFFSQTWSYHAEKHTAVVSLDYPFHGWHELVGCYTRTGWAVEEQSLQPRDTSGGTTGPYLAEIRLSKSLDQHGYLLYSLFDAHGRPVEPGGASPEGGLQALAARVPGRHGTPSCQLQLLVQSRAPLTPDEQRQAKEFFHQVWGILRAQCSDSQGTPP